MRYDLQLRAGQRRIEGARELTPDSDQTLVYEGSAPEFEESGLIGGVDYYYTVFGLNSDGEWVGQAELQIKPKAKHEWVRRVGALCCRPRGSSR